jgi:hypothetical protein
MYQNPFYTQYISRTHRFLNLTVPALKIIIGVCRRSIRPNIMPVPGNIAKKFGFEKLTGFLNKPDLVLPESVWPV